jgi:DNA-binding transcriptional ArsR family regulator
LGVLEEAGLVESRRQSRYKLHYQHAGRTLGALKSIVAGTSHSSRLTTA